MLPSSTASAARCVIPGRVELFFRDSFKLEIDGDNPFRVRAYQNAALAVATAG